jgi:beta-phosphoglucomutase-like phosphatase (HAD superfamily)
MQDWMSALGSHYRQMRRRFPNDKLMVVFDIDGTILDMRYLVHHVLQRYDRAHGTGWFVDLPLEQINVHENRIDPLLLGLDIPERAQKTILAWYQENYWDRDALMDSAHPFDGVFHVARWFQSQPNVDIGLNTGRMATQRLETIRSLSKLGAPYGVHFSSKLLYMRANGWQRTVPESKVAGIRTFQAMGYRVIAMLDNEPDNLAAIAAADPRHDILLLHADTHYLSHRTLLPGHAFRGNSYEPNRLARVPAFVSPTTVSDQVALGN